MTTLEDLAAQLPNGFHDAKLGACSLDFVGRTVVFELELWMGDDADPERYRRARLSVGGLLYCAFDAPDPLYPFADRKPLVVDLCAADPAHLSNAELPANAFRARFWVSNWNSFAHLAGTHAELRWIDSLEPGRFFLNVDLDVDSSEDLAPLVAALEPHAVALERPPGRVSFELNEPISPTTPEPLLVEFVRLIQELPAPLRAVWDRADRRVFDIGIQSGRQPFQERHSLSCEILRAAAEVGAEVALTVYSLADDAARRDG